jgi:FMN-dependent NADH-azoreductase
MTDVNFVYAEGLNMGDETKEKAMSEAQAALAG